MDNKLTAFKSQCREAFAHLLNDHGFHELSEPLEALAGPLQVRFTNGVIELLILGDKRGAVARVYYVMQDGTRVPAHLLEPAGEPLPLQSRQKKSPRLPRKDQLMATAERIRARDADILAGDLTRLTAAAAQWRTLCEKMTRQYKLARRLVFTALALFMVGFLNGTAFWVATAWIGGDAATGKIENGHYYVRSRGHYTEVSRDVWQYSSIHGSTVAVTHVLGLLSIAGLVYFTNRRKRGKQAAEEQELLADWQAQQEKNEKPHAFMAIWWICIGLAVAALLSFAIFHKPKKAPPHIPSVSVPTANH